MTIFRTWRGNDFTTRSNPSQTAKFKVTLSRGNGQGSVAGQGTSPNGSFQVINGTYSSMGGETMIEFEMYYGGDPPTEHFNGSMDGSGSIDVTITVADPDPVDMDDSSTYESYEATVTLN
ncbi:hypothetical protein GALMADRAFT_160397 [Galerina marginata CBS 339.88]|uniref:Uncharacterized protein n=1 Tax=Galerina marginata (strain CBS 339.88) TaxID=685588 RepID=A0A067SSB3_GALM3|nr:hypothetical protein GALMADRAFT_160397 [Galerina marginata CBS 339.88]